MPPPPPPSLPTLSLVWNKMPILAFTRDAVPDLLCRFLRQHVSSLRNWNIALRYSRSYQEFLSESAMTGTDTYLTHALFRAIYISYFSRITLFEIIPEIAFGKRHDPGVITYLTQKQNRRQYYCGRQKLKTGKKLS